MHTPHPLDFAIVALLIFIAVLVVWELIERHRLYYTEPDDDEPEREKWIAEELEALRRASPGDYVPVNDPGSYAVDRGIAADPRATFGGFRRSTPKPVSDPFD